jgi:hypothetical protein
MAQVDWSDVVARERMSTLYLEVKYRDAQGFEHTRKASGFTIRDGGFVLTNKHVVAVKPDETFLSVTAGIGSNEGPLYQLRIINTDNLDIALLQFVNVPASLKPAKIHHGSLLRIGAPVATLGFPRSGPNPDFRISPGTISSLNADIGNGISGIEAAMTIYPGNSGGPVYNQEGEVVGLIVSRLEELESNEPATNIAYFLAIERANSLLQQINDVVPPSTGAPPNRLPPKVYPPGLQLTLNELPEEAFVAPPRAAELSDLRQKLSNYPDVELNNDTLKIEYSNSSPGGQVVLFFSRLKLVDSTLLSLNTNLVLVVDALEIVRSTVRSFPIGVGAAASGSTALHEDEPGGSGANGASAGSVTIYVTGSKSGQFSVDLSGQAGGPGGIGGPGRPGVVGRAGQGGSDHLFDCARGPGDGERGGTGGNGAAGGAGGNGGTGGGFRIFAFDGSAIAGTRSISFVSKGGAGGFGGAGGPGGKGGPGGPRGAQTTYCHGGSDGPPGPPGGSGTKGSDGKNGDDGRLTVDVIAFDNLPHW